MKQKQKMCFIKTNFLLISVYLCQLVSSQDWSYNDQQNWPNISPECSGKYQSPMIIDRTNVEDETQGAPIIFKDTGTMPQRITANNTGHTVKLYLEWGDQAPNLSGGPLNGGRYVLHSFQFHWDSNSNEGSEHQFNRIRAGIEAQFMFIKDTYKTVEEALEHEDGLIMNAAFFEPEERARIIINSPALGKIVQSLDKLQNPGDTIDIEPFPVNEFKTSNPKRLVYYMYDGSLTMPPCTPNVKWVISTYDYYISDDELAAFQSIKLSNGDDHNYRDTQPVNDRKVCMVRAEFPRE